MVVVHPLLEGEERVCAGVVGWEAREPEVAELDPRPVADDVDDDGDDATQASTQSQGNPSRQPGRSQPIGWR